MSPHPQAARGFASSTLRWALFAVLPMLSCGLLPMTQTESAVDTRFAFINLSRTFYAVVHLRPHDETGSIPFHSTPLMPPGAVFRADFATTLGLGCPGTLDLRIFLYARVNASLPIGADPGEAVEPTPVAAGELDDVPACGVQPVETYTIVNWDAPPGTARVKIAQGTAIDSALFAQGRFNNADNVWEVTGVAPGFEAIAPPSSAPSQPISGRVILADGTGIANVGVLLRSGFRVRFDDADPNNDPDGGWSDPIAITKTDDQGNFSIDRPPGAYRLEVFTDGLLFRPSVLDIETPLDVITIIAEPQ